MRNFLTNILKCQKKSSIKHLETYAWQPLEHYDGYKLSNIIDNLAEHIIQEVYPKKENFCD